MAGTSSSGLTAFGPSGVETLAPGLWVNAGARAASRGLLAAGALDGGHWLHDARTSRTPGTAARGLPDAVVARVADDGAGGPWIATRDGPGPRRPGPSRTRAVVERGIFSLSGLAGRCSF